MMLQLPIWRYPAVVIFSLALHGILLLIIFSEYRRNPPPSQIEWFDLREMTLTPSEIPEKSQSASAISAVPKKVGYSTGTHAEYTLRFCKKYLSLIHI